LATATASSSSADAEHRRGRPEGLLACGGHLRVDVVEDRRRVEEARAVERLAAGQQLGALSTLRPHLLVELVAQVLAGQRSDVGGTIHRVADHRLARSRRRTPRRTRPRPRRRR
jgi:hypothetical protein